MNKLEDKWDSELWILNADGSQHRFLVKGGAPRWSPDGKRLLYQAEGEPKGSQLFVRWVDAEGPATQITHITEAPRNAKWSPDGKSIAFSMFVPSTDKWTISMPGEPKGAKWTPAPRVVSTIHYRQDQVGYLEDGFTHLFVVPADGGTARQLTTGKWSVGSGELRGGASIDWTPDSKSIVFDGNRSPDADMQYETSQIYVADVATGAIRELVTKAGRVGEAGGLARRPHRRVHRLRADRPLAHGQRHVGRPDLGRLRRHAQDQRRLRSRSDQHEVGAGRDRACTSTPTTAARATSSSRRSSAASSR